MPKVNKRLFSIILSLLFVLSLVIGVTAIINRQKPGYMAENFEQTIINRVNFLIENTDFVFIKTEEEQEFELDLQVYAKKTEADFYALINSIVIEDFDFNSSIISPEGKNTKALPDAPLPVVGGKPQDGKWNVFISFGADESIETSAKLKIVYTSGVKAEATNKHLLTVPIKISVLDHFSLLDIIERAGASSSASTPGLNEAIDEGNRQITLKYKAKPANIKAAYNKILAELEALG